MQSKAIPEWLLSEYNFRLVPTTQHNHSVLLRVTKTLRIMRFTATILLFACLHVCAGGFGQGKITLVEKNAPLEKVISEIQLQTTYNIWYDKLLFPRNATVSVNLKDATLEDALNQCCASQDLEFSIAGTMVVIRKRGAGYIIPEGKIDVRGKIVNENGEPLPGTNISVKNTTLFAASDENGVFVLHQIDPASILVFTRVGYESQEIKLHGKQDILAIRMNSASNKLDEVQVIAYGTTTRRLNTGDVGTVNSSVIEKQPVSNVLAAIQGRVPGLYITQQTGVPGGGFTARIMGQNSIASGNNPLYIIDGVPFASSSITPIGFGSGANATAFELPSPLSSVNPSDIESIDILKDADATSIYGSRAANGVILITTKKGKEGKTTMNLNAYFGGGKVSHFMPLLTTSQYLPVRHEAFQNDGFTPDPNVDFDLLQWDTTRNTNWQKTLLGGTASISDIQLSVSGGNHYTQFLLGGGYHQEGTVFSKNFSDKKASGHISLTHNTTNNRFHISFTGNYVTESNDLPYSDLTYYALSLPPNAPNVYDSSGHMNWENSTWTNPMSYLNQPYKASTNNLIVRTLASFEIIKDLQLRLSLGYNNLLLNEVASIPARSIKPSDLISGNQIPTSFFKTASQNTWIVEPQIQYKKNFLGGFIDILLGGTIQQIINQGQAIYATGFSSDALMEDPQAATSLTILNQVYTNYRYAGFFGRINFNFQDKYIIDITGRRDGSSRFGQGNQFSNFGALGAAWLFTNERFFKEHIRFISYGKLRGSIGTTGNDQIGDYQFLSTYSPYQFSYQGSAGLFPSQLANPNYEWETNRKYEMGIDLGFLKDYILFSIAYYNSRTSNQLVGYSLPLTTGFQFVEANLPATIQNTGLEIELNSTNVKSNHFKWTTGFNITIPTNKLVAYPNIEGSSYANLYQVGKSIHIFKSFHYTNVDPATGVYQFQDLDHDGEISYPDDLQAIKKTGPVLYGGLQNTITFKNWGLGFFFQFVKQDGFNYLYYLQNGFVAPGQMGNQPTYVLSRWQKPGDQAPIQRYTQDYGSEAYAAYSNSQFSGDNAVSDASFIRLKNVSLTYHLNESVLSKIHLREANIFLLGQNLLTITGYKGMDPENQNISSLPALIQLTAGIKIIL